MPRKNTLVFITILALFTLAVAALFNPWFGREAMRLGLDLQGGLHMVYQVDLSSVEPGEEDNTVEGVMAVMGNRINPLGVTEPVIQRQGYDRIVVELPGIDITDKEKERLSRVTLLEFGELAADDEEARWENEWGRWKPATAVVDGVEKTLTSRYFNEKTQVGIDELRGIELLFQWNAEGSELSKIITGRLIGQKLGIFEGNASLRGDDGRPIAPIVNTVITENGVITGLSRTEATSISQQLNAGRLPVSLEILYDQTVSPILGANFIDMSVKAGIIGLVLVMLFMIAYYRLSGLLASLALIFYGALVLALFKMFPVTLTLAGLGGFILSIGMAVDANVLIFERMKEELRTGRRLGAAIETGFNRAWTGIRDSNITTIIVCVILYVMGNTLVAGAPVKGFAVTLLIGVLISMFTAIVVTRTLLRLFVGTGLAGKTSLFSAYVRKE